MSRRERRANASLRRGFARRGNDPIDPISTGPTAQTHDRWSYHGLAEEESCALRQAAVTYFEAVDNILVSKPRMTAESLIATLVMAILDTIPAELRMYVDVREALNSVANSWETWRKDDCPLAPSAGRSPRMS